MFIILEIWEGAHGHWVRTTSMPNFSELTPGIGSYKERPIAWMGIFFLVVESFKKVRFIFERMRGENAARRGKDRTH
jgi:hypothetical protein